MHFVVTLVCGLLRLHQFVVQFLVEDLRHFCVVQVGLADDPAPALNNHLLYEIDLLAGFKVLRRYLPFHQLKAKFAS